MPCHPSSPTRTKSANGNIALVGQPNVGKSVIFQRLTGQHVAISNYPGTTVEVARGKAHCLADAELVDTPGLITFPPHTEDEEVTERLLFQGHLRAVLQVGDAKNLRRTLLLTVQIAELGLPMVLALNMMDEAEARGVSIDIKLLTNHLVIPVVTSTATRGQGIDKIVEELQDACPPQFRLTYAPEIESCLAEICTALPQTPVAPRAVALLWLSGDQVAEKWIKERLAPADFEKLREHRQTMQLSFHQPISFVIQKTRLDFVDRISSEVIQASGDGWRGFSTFLGDLTTHPIWGLFILSGVLYLLYLFVGEFGAGYLVDLLETKLFGQLINPRITAWIQSVVPFQFLRDALIGQYGLWTMGMTYALALILPIVTTFFLAFGVMEDSGYLPRLAALSNRLFQMLGLNGKAVLPMVLGLGCVTMATLTTRVLESKRERILVTLLLALAVPCSAQLGVVMGILAGISIYATLIWGGVVLGILLLIGWLAAHLMPGERTGLLVELPPLRRPMISNVLLKTLARLEWYLKEVVPLFLLGTATMFLLDKTGVLGFLIQASEPLVTGWLGLPAQTSAAFLMGFLRRDFGAAGLYIMVSQGLLNPVQVVVAMVTVTLFVPCFASVLMIAKERGWRTAGGMLVLIFPLAFLVGGLLERFLILVGWGA